MALLTLTIFLITPLYARERLTADFNWLFHLGESGLVQCTDADFPINMAGVQCLGLSEAQASNIDDCRNACCGDPNCQTYQWCPQSQPKGCTPASSCWIGARKDCSNGTGWESMGRPTPAPIVGPIAPNYNDSNWTKKNVPHDFVVETGAFNPNNDKSHGYLPKNISWYRKHFSLDSSYKGQSIWLDFDGVYRNSNFFLNGIYLGNHQSGYTSFRWYIDQLPNIQYGANSDNVLAVRVDPTHNEGWWYEGGGIYRHTWINVANYVHIKPWGVYAGSTVTSLTSTTVGNANLDMQTNITYNISTGNAVTVSLLTVIKEKISGKVIGNNTQSGIKLSVGQETQISQKFNFNNVQLWSIKSPILHVAISSLIDESTNKIIDSVTTNFGFRKAVFDVNKGLSLNGEYVKMTGFCNHQDFAGCGVAMPDRVNKFRVNHLQSIGANSWRMSHNPPNPELLDFTDEYGMLVWDENRNFANNAQYLQDQEDMINRDKNHPSIVIWSLCNEGGCMEGSSDGAAVGKMFEAIIRRIDNVIDRPISAAMNADWGDSLSTVLDIQGINYNYGQYDSYHKAHPQQPIISSESCSCTSDRGEYVSSSSTGHVSAYTSCVWSCWQPVAQRQFVIGSMDWTGFDYKGEPTPYSWPDVNSHFGVTDLAGFPKDDSYYYKSWWLQGNETVIHILPNDWNQWKQGSKVNVWVYGNVAYVDLELNGKSVSNGMKSITSAIPNIFSVIYAPGILNAIGYDAKKNNIVNYTLSTSDVPYAIELIITYPGSTIYCDGQDVALIEVRIVDVNGIRVPYASNMIDFSISGDGIIYGVGNGDNASHEPDKANSRSVFHGLARVIVQSLLNKPGEMILTASSKGLLSKSVTIYTVPNPEQMFYV
eukprot:451018_1